MQWVSGRVLAHWTFDDAGGVGTLEGYFVEVFRMADSVDVDMQPVLDTSSLSAIRSERTSACAAAIALGCGRLCIGMQWACALMAG